MKKTILSFTAVLLLTAFSCTKEKTKVVNQEGDTITVKTTDMDSDSQKMDSISQKVDSTLDEAGKTIKQGAKDLKNEAKEMKEKADDALESKKKK